MNNMDWYGNSVDYGARDMKFVLFGDRANGEYCGVDLVDIPKIFVTHVDFVDGAVPFGRVYTVW